MNTKRRGKTQLLVTAVIVASGLLLAGCSNAPPPAESGGSMESNGSGEAVDLAAIQTKVDAAMDSVPTEFSGPTQTVTPPKGLHLAFISCNAILRGCVNSGEAGMEAADALGWTYDFYDGKGDPALYNDLILRSLSGGVDAIMLTGIDPAVIQSGLQAAKDADVPVVSMSQALSSPNPTYTPPEGGLNVALDVMNDMDALGRALANWIILDSNGTGTVQFFLAKEFGSNVIFQEAMHDEFEAACSTCTILPEENFLGSDLTDKLGPQTVAILRNNPEIEYIVASFDPAAVVQAQAIRQAGMQDQVQIVSILGNAQNQDLIRNGDVQAADGAYDNTYMGYAAIDQLIRILTDVPLADPLGENTPYVLLTKDNLPDEPGDWESTKFDYKSEFLKLWGLG